MSSSSSPPLAAPPIAPTTTTTTTNLAPDGGAQSEANQPPHYSTTLAELNTAACRQQTAPNPIDERLGADVSDNDCSSGSAMQTTTAAAKSTPLVRANMMTIMMEPADTSANSAGDNGHLYHHHHQQQQQQPQHCQHPMPFACQASPSHQRQQQKQLQVKENHQNQLQAASQSPGHGQQTAASSVSPSSVSNPDTRTHVVGELYDTERSYVESLQILTEKYMKPLKSLEGNKNLIESSLVDEIFYTIPEILQHHETFLGALQDRLSSDWDSSQVIGNVFIEAFTNQQIIDIYTAFINNWKNARQAIKVAVQAKPAFERFLEAMSREHRNKLTLDALLIMPVQRIPRYELLIKELIKHTPANHQDHGPLIEAQKKIHELALKIDRAEKEMLQQEQLRDLESLIEGHVELHHPQRDFIRYDLVTISASTLTVAKKERVLFLFCDLLIMTSVKKKVSRRSNLQAAFSNSSNDISLLEGNKFKLLLRVSLDQIEIKHDGEQQAQLLQQQQQQQQLQLLTQQKQMIQSLRCEFETDLCILQQMKSLNEKTSNADHRTRLDMMLDDMTNNLRCSLTSLEQQNGCGDISQAQLAAGLQQPNVMTLAPSPTQLTAQDAASAGRDLYVIQSSTSSPTAANEFPAASSPSSQQQQQASETPNNTSLEFMILNTNNSLQPQQPAISSRDSSANSNVIPMTSGSDLPASSGGASLDGQPAQHETLVVTFTSAERRQAFLQAFLEAKQQRFNLHQQRQQQRQQQQQKMFSSSVTLRLSQSDSSPTDRERRTRLQHQDEVNERNNNCKRLIHQHSQGLGGGTIVHQMSAPQALNEACGTLSELNNGYLRGTNDKSSVQMAHQQARSRDCSSCLASASANTIGMDEPHSNPHDRGINFIAHSRHHHHQLMHQPASHPALLSTFCCNEQHNNSSSNNELKAADQNNNNQSSKHQHSEVDRLCNLDETSSDLVESSSTGSGYLTMLNDSHRSATVAHQRASSVIALANEKSNLECDEQKLDSLYQGLKFTPRFLLSLPAMNFLNTQHPTLQFTCSTTREKFTVISEFKFNEMDNIVEKRQTIRDVSGQLWLCMSNGYVSHVALISLVKREQQQQQQRGTGTGPNDSGLCYTSITPVIHSAGDICKSHINCATQVRWQRKSRPSVIKTSEIMMKRFNMGSLSDAKGSDAANKLATGQQQTDIATAEEKLKIDAEEPVELAIQSTSVPIEIITRAVRDEKLCVSESAPLTTTTTTTVTQLTRSSVERQNSNSSTEAGSFRRPIVQRAQTPPTGANNKTNQICRRYHHNSYDYLRNNQPPNHRKRPVIHCNKARLLGNKQQHDNQTANYNMSRGQHFHPGCHNHQQHQQHHQNPMHQHSHHHHLPHHHHHHHHHHHNPHHHHHHHHSHQHGHLSSQHHHTPAHHNHPHLYDNRHHTVPLAELRRALERQTRVVDDSQVDEQQRHQKQLAPRSSSLMPPIDPNHPVRTLNKPDSSLDLTNTEGSPVIRDTKARSTTPPARFNTGQRSLRSARMLRHQASLKTSAILAKLVSGASRKSSSYLKSKSNLPQQQNSGNGKSETDKGASEQDGSGVGDDTPKLLDSPSIEGNHNSATKTSSLCQLAVPRMMRLSNLSQFNPSNPSLHTPIVSPLSSVSSLNSTTSSLTVNSACGSSLNRSNCSILNTAQQPWSSTTCCALAGNRSSGELSSSKNINLLATHGRPDYSDSRSILNRDEDVGLCPDDVGGGMRGRSATVPCRAFCRQTSVSVDLDCSPCPLTNLDDNTIKQRLQNSGGIAEQVKDQSGSYKVSTIVHDSEEPDQRQRQQSTSDQDENSSSLWLGCDNGTLIIIDCLSGNSAPDVGDCDFCDGRDTGAGGGGGNHRRNLTCQNVHAEIELGSSISDIRVYKDEMVFVALANGQLVIFSRQDTAAGENKWSLTEPRTLNLATSEHQPRSSATTLASKLCLINDEYLWYSHGKSIYVVQIATLNLETIIMTPTGTCSSSSSSASAAAIGQSAIDQMEFVSNLNGVWLSFENCPLIQFYDVSSYKLVIEISLLEPISKILSYGNEILRQHKTACLRATSLLDIYNQEDDCNSLFIGTSAGIIIYLTIKRSQLDEFLKADRQQLSEIVWTPQVVSLRHGHSGQVKFLHLIELMEQSNENQPASQQRHFDVGGEQNKAEQGRGERTTTSDQSNKFAKSVSRTLCLISGGAGVDIYGPSDESQLQLQAQHLNSDEDCMNHLMLWQLCSR